MRLSGPGFYAEFEMGPTPRSSLGRERYFERESRNALAAVSQPESLRRKSVSLLTIYLGMLNSNFVRNLLTVFAQRLSQTAGFWNKILLQNRDPPCTYSRFESSTSSRSRISRLWFMVSLPVVTVQSIENM